MTTINSLPPVTAARTNEMEVDDGTSGKVNVTALLGLVEAGDLNLTGPGVIGRTAAGPGKASLVGISALLDLISGANAQGAILFRGASGWSALAPGTNGHFLRTQGTGANPQWAAAPAGGSADDWEVVDNSVNSGSALTLANSTGNAVSIVNMTANCTISRPTTFTGSAGIQYGRLLVLVGNASNPFTLTFGTGISLGVGVAPSLTVPANQTVVIMLYTRDVGATFQYDGDPDYLLFPAANPDPIVDELLFADGDDQRRIKRVRLGAITPVVDISVNTTLTRAAHQDRVLRCTAAVSLTVDANTDFDVGFGCEILAQNGNVTIVEGASTTVAIRSGATRVIAGDSAGGIARKTTADTYHLFGGLVLA